MPQRKYTNHCKGLALCCKGNKYVIFEDTYHFAVDGKRENLEKITRTCIECGDTKTIKDKPVSHSNE